MGDNSKYTYLRVAEVKGLDEAVEKCIELVRQQLKKSGIATTRSLDDNLQEAIQRSVKK
jgi:glycerol-3-phosphate responsive antiterminator